MTFKGDVKSDKGLKEFNDYLLDKSYVSGYTLSNEDSKVFKQFSKVPAASHQNVLRWYNHIKARTGGKDVPAAKAEKPAADDDDDVDLFGSDSEGESAEAEKLRNERLEAYNAKKSKKPALIAKSSVVLDVKPWDDETDMKEMEKLVRKIEMEGLVWGASKLVPVGYGINKLQIMCVVEDEKVSIDALAESIQELEDLVQSVDVAAFNKI